VEYSKAPVVTRERMYLETMQEIMSNTSKVLVDTKSNSLLYLPLDKLIHMSGSVTAAPPTDAPPIIKPSASEPSGTVIDSTNRSRDALRSRDREGR
jgi:modulator of FtsH protease HflK